MISRIIEIFKRKKTFEEILFNEEKIFIDSFRCGNWCDDSVSLDFAVRLGYCNSLGVGYDQKIEQLTQETDIRKSRMYEVTLSSIASRDFIHKTITEEIITFRFMARSLSIRSIVSGVREEVGNSVGNKKSLSLHKILKTRDMDDK